MREHCSRISRDPFFTFAVCITSLVVSLLSLVDGVVHLLNSLEHWWSDLSVEPLRKRVPEAVMS